jgi:hypothetical protein
MSLVIVALAAATVVSASPPRTPTIFAPGEISAAANVDSAAFAPDGQTIYFDQSTGPVSTIVVSHRAAGHWSKPQVAPFSGTWSDKDPAMAPDGAFIVFGSNRPGDGHGPPLDLRRADNTVVKGQGNQLWRVDRRGSGWGAPVRLPDSINEGVRIHSPSVIADGSLYFQRFDPETRVYRLFRSAWRGGAYQPPQPVRIGPVTADERDPAVAPDESFIVLSANYAAKGAPNRLYIAFREGGAWGEPIDLGDAVNHDGAEGPHLGPDSRSIYFDRAATLPVALPRAHAQAARDLARALVWDNGASHLWKLDLSPWLDEHRRSIR